MELNEKKITPQGILVEDHYELTLQIYAWALWFDNGHNMHKKFFNNTMPTPQMHGSYKLSVCHLLGIILTWIESNNVHMQYHPI
jgi:hypothetical protein